MMISRRQERASEAWRYLLVVAFALAAAGFLPRPAAASEVTTLPTLTAKARTSAVTVHGRKVLLVRGVSVLRASRAWSIAVSCPGCVRRRPSAKRTTSWHGTTWHRAGLDWLVPRGRRVTISVTQPATTGRWLTLVASPSASSTRIGSTGCLDDRARKVACPSPTPTVLPVAAAPVAPVTAPVPAPVPVAVPLGGDPEGRLTSADRVGTGDVRLRGWARDPDSGDSAILVKAQIDGKVTSRQGLANLSRVDVGPHGFDLIVPIDAKAHIVCVQAMNVLGGNDVQLTGCVAVKPLGDLDGDGYVGCADVRIMQAAYGTSGPDSRADLNADGIVDTADVSLLVSRFAPPPGEPPCV